MFKKVTRVLGKTARHLREGTLDDVLAVRRGKMAQPVRVHWRGARSEEDAAGALAKQGLRAWNRHSTSGWVAVVGSGSLQRRVLARLARLSVAHRDLTRESLLQLGPDDLVNLKLILCTFTRSREIEDLGQTLLGTPRLAEVPFEYAPGLDPEDVLFRKRDQYADTHFVSPVLRDNVPVYAIYEESLQLFEQKCGLRDYLDLYQILRHLHVHNVPGAICEFGSYRGHSGWLMARLQQALGSNRPLYLFDMFEAFPQEPYGVDKFWSSTHDVDFDEVRSKFSGFEHVHLVKGDFTQTLDTLGPQQIAMAYVDCDSYRATRSLVEQIWHPRLSRNGAMVFEDYGHLALLGNRVAVDEAVREPGLGFQFFSQFSGFYIAVKTE